MYFIKAGNPLTENFISGHFYFHLHQRNFHLCAGVGVSARPYAWMSNIEIKRREGKDGVLVRAHQPEVDYHGVSGN